MAANPDVATVAAAAREAARRLAGHVRRTPLEYSPRFSEETGARVWFKLENFQRTGSFKLRGAMNRLLTMSSEERASGCVTASSGNHGAAVACAMRELDIDGVVFVPTGASDSKVAAIRARGVEVRRVGEDGLDTEKYARRYAADRGMSYVSPYNDPAVVAGQGSCGVEIAEDLPDADAVFVAVGGGGLIGGVASVLKSQRARIAIIGCQPERSAVMARSAEAGRIVELESRPTLSDGTAGGIEPGSITFALCRALVDEYRLVDETEIAAAMRRYIGTEHQLIEGAAGVAIAALLQNPEPWAGKKVVVIICGANAGTDVLERVICREAPAAGSGSET